MRQFGTLSVCIVVLFVSAITTASADDHSKSSKDGFTVAYFDVPMARKAKVVLGDAYRQIGIRPNFRQYPSARAIQMVASGEYDGDLIRVERTKLQFPDLTMVPTPVSEARHVMVQRRGDAYSSRKGWDALLPHEHAVLDGLVIYDQKAPLASVRAKTARQLVRLLEDRRVDVIALPRSYLDQMSNLTTTLEVLDPPLEVTPLYHFVHKRHKDLIPRLDAAIKNHLRQRGTS